MPRCFGEAAAGGEILAHRQVHQRAAGPGDVRGGHHAAADVGTLASGAGAI